MSTDSAQNVTFSMLVDLRLIDWLSFPPLRTISMLLGFHHQVRLDVSRSHGIASTKGVQTSSPLPLDMLAVEKLSREFMVC